MERGCALLGYAPVGNIGLLLMATRLRTAATLPGGHAVRLVTESRWMLIPLEVGRPAWAALNVQRLQQWHHLHALLVEISAGCQHVL